VRIPFAEKLILPNSKLISRRAFPQLLTLIETVALLRQYQKKPHRDGHIEAHSNDYKIAYDLMRPILGRTFAPLPQRATKMLSTILQRVGSQQPFTRSDCQQWAGVGATEVRNRLVPLVEAGLLEQLKGDRGVRFEYRVISENIPWGATLSGLITPATLRKQLRKKPKASSKLAKRRTKARRK
jgi:hypothetical protein